MSDTTFDPKTIFENYRNAFAPALKAQQEGVKTLDRVGRYQFDVAGAGGSQESIMAEDQ